MLTLWTNHWSATKPTQASYFCGMDSFSYDTPCCYFELFKIYFIEDLCLTRFWCLQVILIWSVLCFMVVWNPPFTALWTWLFFLFLLILGILLSENVFCGKYAGNWALDRVLHACPGVHWLNFLVLKVNRWTEFDLYFFFGVSCPGTFSLLITKFPVGNVGEHCVCNGALEGFEGDSTNCRGLY